MAQNTDLTRLSPARRTPAIALGVLAFAAGLPVSAQDGTGDDLAADAAMEPVEMEQVEMLPAEPVSFFEDAELESIANLFVGTWRSVGPVEGPLEGDADDAEVHLTFAPVLIEGVANAFYSETTRVDEPGEPYDAAVHTLIRTSSGIRLRTHRIVGLPDAAARALAGTFGLGDRASTAIPTTALYPTLDYLVMPEGDGFRGTTPFPFPTSLGGAIEFKGSFAVTGDTLMLAERGFDAQGEIVWGPTGSGGNMFERVEDAAGSMTTDNGVTVISYAQGEGPVAGEGDYLVVHYEGYLPDGRVFDASANRGEPFRYQLPGRLIAGWQAGLADARAGDIRRLFIPSSQAYGETGARGSIIGPDQDIRFFITVEAVEPGE